MTNRLGRQQRGSLLASGSEVRQVPFGAAVVSVAPRRPSLQNPIRQEQSRRVPQCCPQNPAPRPQATSAMEGSPTLLKPWKSWPSALGVTLTMQPLRFQGHGCRVPALERKGDAPPTAPQQRSVRGSEAGPYRLPCKGTQPWRVNSTRVTL